MEDKLAKHKGAPDVNNLVAEYRRSLDEGLSLTSIRDAEDTRFARWSGQADDGKKWSHNLPEGTQAFPFDGASDCRVYLADQVISDCVDMLSVAHQRAELRVNPVDLTDTEPSAAASTLMGWVRSTMHNDLQRECELLANYVGTYGWGVMFVGWDQQATLRNKPISLDQLMAVAQQSDPGSLLAELPMIVTDPNRADQASELLMQFFPDIKKRRANKIIKELREDGSAVIPEAYLCRNRPAVVALKPHEEVTVPPETINLQDARVVFRRQYMTEVELRSKVLTDNWSKEFVEEALHTAGKSLNYLDQTTLTGLVSEFNRGDNLVEIVWAYTRQLDGNGVPSIYYTVFCPLMQSVDGAQKFALHEMLDYAHNEYPFVLFRREHVARRLVECRGIPAIVKTWQGEIKAQRDSIYDSTSFETLPPLQVSKRLGLANKIGPGVQLPVTKPGDYAWLQPPARPPQTAFSLIEMISLQVDAYFGRPNAKIPQPQTMMKQQRIVNEWLRSYSEVYRHAFRLCVQYMAPEEIMRITGTPAAEAITQEAVRFDFNLKFNVSEMDNELVKQKMQTIATAIVPLDVAGTIDRGRLIDKLLRAVAPESADELLTDQVGASRKMYEEVKNDIGNMLVGIEATYTDASNDPTSPVKMQFAQEIASTSPGVQVAMQGGNELFGQLFEKYMQNLQMGMQQQQNKQVGRWGVQPMGAQPQGA
jgi:hypothetical protein